MHNDTSTNLPSAPAKAMIQEIECLLCRSIKPADTMFVKDPFRIVKCASCNLVYTLPRLPSNIIWDMYQEDYWQSEAPRHFGYSDYLSDRERNLRTFRQRYEVIRRFKPEPGRVLDIGCAAGFFLKVMHEEGWNPVGIEPSESMAQYAREEFDLQEVYSGTLEDDSFEDNSFDVVSMWDVIEHLEDPRPILKNIRRILKQDGVLILETQNVGSVFAKLMGVKWHHYKFEEHLWHFSKETIADLLVSEGFDVVESSPRRGGRYISMDFIIERAGRVHRLLSGLLAPLKLFRGLNLYVNPMDEMIVVARKSHDGKHWQPTNTTLRS
jgi:SAM-dependent methyltransferase